jgi:cytochrome d ubiquinol oxidase subunit II
MNRHPDNYRFCGSHVPGPLFGQPALAAVEALAATHRAYFLVLAISIIILAPSLMFLYWTFIGEPGTERPRQLEG